MSQKETEEYLYVDQIVKLPFTESAGLYISRFLTKIRDEGKIVANKCPKCNRIIVPPRIVCSYCKVKIEDKPENWVELSDKGTVTDTMTIEDREIDAVTGEMVGAPNPNLFIRLDGGDEWTIIGHISEEMDASKVPPGTRVQAVWKPREERLGKVSDIKYFKVIQE
ncbi:MAG: Zn-ribbon domain-containing OB-fold protein [Thermodesulfobacteriota bacterium]